MVRPPPTYLVFSIHLLPPFTLSPSSSTHSSSVPLYPLCHSSPLPLLLHFCLCFILPLPPPTSPPPLTAQLDRIDEGLDQIGSDMKEAVKNLTDLGKCCGLCSCEKLKAIEKNMVYKAVLGGASSQDGVVSSQPPSSRVADEREQMVMSGEYITRVTHDGREAEMEDNMNHISSIIGNVKSMAVDMGQAIDRQNDQIENIQSKVNINKARINTANKKANNLMKR
uniref:synaptosomal-associated protein 25 isoform X1 n=1 Tax=Monopterus albus TaxID=43700 RepID=UPI0009B40226|nr:synaptosomal-associated protein 25-like isoform X1 [Monopterus albus]